MARIAADLVWQALRNPLRWDLHSNELRIADASAREAAALLPHLDDVQVDEWTGESGQTYRDYVGRLPCGVTLRVSTDAVLVPVLIGGAR